MFEIEERRRGWGESVSEWMKDKLWIWEVRMLVDEYKWWNERIWWWWIMYW